MPLSKRILPHGKRSIATFLTSSSAIGVSKLVAGDNITLSPTVGTGSVTITAGAGGGGGTVDPSTLYEVPYFRSTTALSGTAAMSYDTTDEKLMLTSSVAGKYSLKLKNTNNSSVVNGLLIADDADGSRLAIAHSNVDDENNIWGYENIPMKFATNDTERMRIAGDGKVGIGTTSPAEKLTVGGNGKFLLDYHDTGPKSSTEMFHIVTSGTEAAFAIEAQSSGSGIKNMALLPNLNQDIKNLGQYWDSGGGNYTDIYEWGWDGNATPDNRKFQFKMTDEYPIHFIQDNNDRLVIASGGNVGIGTTGPTAKLHVVGKMVLNDGANNVAIGTAVGGNITTASQTVLIGSNAGTALTTGTYNTVMGYDAFKASVGGTYNVAIGHSAMRYHSQAAAAYNVALGSKAMYNIDTGVANVVLGDSAMYGKQGTTNSDNVAIGASALYYAEGAMSNVAIGQSALNATTTGDENTAIGLFAGIKNTTGDGNVFIGANAGNNTDHATVDDKLVIANSNTTTPLIGGDFSANTVTIAGDLTVGVSGVDDYGRVSVSGNALGGYMEKFGGATDGAVGFYAGAGQRGILLDATNNFLSAGTRWYVQSPFRISGTNALELGDDEHYIYNDGTDLIIRTVTTATNGIVVDSKVDTTFKIDGTAEMTLDSTGLGIGTTAPSGKLHVVGGDEALVIERNNTDSSIYGPSLYIQRKRATAPINLPTDYLIGNITFRPFETDFDNRAATISAAVEGTVTTDTTPGRLMFSTAAAGANTVTERMRIDSTGNVGIGTNAPEALLHVEGTDDLPIAIYSGSGDTTYHYKTSSGGDISFQYHVAQGRSADIALISNADSGEKTTIRQKVIDANNSYMLFRTRDAGALTNAMILSGAKVGIGTTAPSELLHLESALESKPVLLIQNTNADSVAGELQFYKNATPNEANDDVAGNISWYFDNDGSVDGVEKVRAAQIYATSSDVVEDVEDGTLFGKHVYNGTEYQNFQFGGHHNAGNTAVWFGEEGTSSIIAMANNTADNNYLFFGRGLTTGSYQVSKISIGNNAAGGAQQVNMYAQDDLGLWAGQKGSTSNCTLSFGTNNVAGSDSKIAMRIDKDGNVGIGTVAPNKTLEVIGKIHASSSTSTDAIYYSNGQPMIYYGGAGAPHMNLYSGPTSWRVASSDGSTVLMTLTDGGSHTGNLTLLGDISVGGNAVVTGSTLAVQKAIKTDIADTAVLSDTYSHYMIPCITADAPASVTITVTAPASPAVGDEYFITSKVGDGGGGFAGETGTVRIVANTGQTINGVSGNINIDTRISTTPKYTTAHLICVDTNTWAMTISDVGPVA